MNVKDDLLDPKKVFQSGAPSPKLTSPAKVKHQRAVCSLLHTLDWHPEEAAVYWLSLAHAAAMGKLPSRVIHRLGYPQQPLPIAWGEVICDVTGRTIGEC